MAAPVASDQYSPIAGPVSSTACFKTAPMPLTFPEGQSFQQLIGLPGAPYQSLRCTPHSSGKGRLGALPLIQPPGSVCASAQAAAGSVTHLHHNSTLQVNCPAL